MLGSLVVASVIGIDLFVVIVSVSVLRRDARRRRDCYCLHKGDESKSVVRNRERLFHALAK